MFAVCIQWRFRCNCKYYTTANHTRVSTCCDLNIELKVIRYGTLHGVCIPEIQRGWPLTTLESISSLFFTIAICANIVCCGIAFHWVDVLLLNTFFLFNRSSYYLLYDLIKRLQCVTFGLLIIISIFGTPVKSSHYLFSHSACLLLFSFFSSSSLFYFNLNIK